MLAPLRIARALAGVTLVVGFAAGASACRGRPAKAPLPPVAEECRAVPGQARRLVVGGELDGAALLARIEAARLVPVRWRGCVIEPLWACHVPHEWFYVGHAPVSRETRIRSEAELLANVAQVDRALAGQVTRASEVLVRRTLVGRWDAGLDEIDPSRIPKSEACAGATHVVTMVTVGAYELVAPASFEAAGDAAACAVAAPGDPRPPMRCGEAFGLELLPIGRPRRPEPLCSGHTRWDGLQCVDACASPGSLDKCYS